MSTLNNLSGLAGRILVAGLFIWSGWGKIIGYDGAMKYMQSGGLPGQLLPLVIGAEIIGGLALVVGFQTRLAALGLAAFTLVAGFLFHFVPADMGQMVHFAKNLSITGGLLAFAMAGAGDWSVDAVLGRPHHVPLNA